MKSKMVILTLICVFAFSLMVVGQSHAAIDKKNVKGIWLLDEGAGDIAKDLSGNGNNGVFKGKPKWVDGQFGKALQFDGSSGVEISTPDNFNFTTWTWSFWFKCPAGGDYPNLVGRQFADGKGWTIHQDPSGAIFKIRIDTDAQINQCPNIPGKTRDDKWHYGAISQDDKNKKLVFYFDETTGQGTYAGNYKNSGGFLVIGLACVGASNFNGGAIDDFAIFDSILTEDDITNIRTNGLKAAMPGVFAVSAGGKLAGTWGEVKEVDTLP
jgi:hypothetical protein